MTTRARSGRPSELLSDFAVTHPLSRRAKFYSVQRDGDGAPAPRLRLGLGREPKVDSGALDRPAGVGRDPSGITPGSTATTPYPVGAPVAVRPWIEYPVASTVIVGPFTPGAGVGP